MAVDALEEGLVGGRRAAGGIGDGGGEAGGGAGGVDLLGQRSDDACLLLDGLRPMLSPAGRELLALKDAK